MNRAPLLVIVFNNGCYNANKAPLISAYPQGYSVQGRHFVGTDLAPAPRYDLRYQQDVLSAVPMSIVTTGAVEPIAQIPLPAPAEPEDNRLYIWLAIGVVVLILGWMSVKMLREMKTE